MIETFELAYAPIDGLAEWLEANPGFEVVSHLSHHTRYSVLCERRLKKSGLQAEAETG